MKWTCVNKKCPFYHTDMTGPDGKSYIDYLELEDGYQQPICVACEDAMLNLGTIQNSLKLLKKSLRKIYPTNEASKELSETILAVTADIASIRSEVEDLASETADETEKLKSRLDDTQST